MQELYLKLNRVASLAAEMFVGRERFATLLLMRLTETVILWLSEDQSFWDDIEEGPRPLGPLGLQQVRNPCYFHLVNCVGTICAWIKLSVFLFAVLFGYEIRHVLCISRSLFITAFASSHQ